MWTDPDTNLATDMYKKGHSAKEMLDALAGRVTINEVYQLRCSLKKSNGDAAPRRGGVLKHKKNGKRTAKRNGLDENIQQEIARLNAENEKLNEIMGQYGDTNIPFTEHLEKKIQANTKKLELLEELANV